MALGKGQIAPATSLTTKDGKVRSLDEIVADGPALLAFYKVSCPVCQLALPFLERLRGGKLQVVPISQNDPESAAEFDEEFGTRTELFDDEEREFPASNAFGLTHVPSLFVVEPDRRISWESIGFFRKDLETLAAAAERTIFLPGEKVPEAKSG